jgi:DNA-binding PadR family transcriptional regulator
MGKRPRMTLQTKLVLRALSKDPRKPRYGLDISKESGLPDGSVYTILVRLETAGLLHSAWEEIDPAKEGRPRRRHYWLTGEGVRVAREIEPTTPWLTWAPRPRGAQ